ncbi:MAG TPA: zinc ribbon domain-containing protein [Symbiobacteriaceae bacterium]|nr:zinc ribbon domain-containing protein [Symbiobacteriaceae bacterium]
MASCTHCQSPLAPGASFCPACGQPVTQQAGTEQVSPSQASPSRASSGPDLAAHAAQIQGQATAAAKQAWVMIQGAGPARVGVALMAVSAVLGLVWKSQRSIWYAGWAEIIIALALMAYVGMREFMGQDPLQRFWWAPHAAASYLALWGLSYFQLKLASLIFLGGAFLLAWCYLSYLKDWVKSAGFDWRYSLHGYRRVILIGAVLAFVALFFTWIPESRGAGYWSGGYTYSSYYGESVYDTMKYYNPGFWFPSHKGLGLSGSVIMQALLLGCVFFAGFAPQIAVPKWYRHIPFIAAGAGLLFMLAAGSISWGQLLFLPGIGLITWGGYQLSIKGVAEGRFDFREVPLERFLKK